jgi:polyhydroxybutyrate depolymerase
MQRRAHLAAFIAISILGCGDDDGSSTSAGGSPGTSGSTGSVAPGPSSSGAGGDAGTTGAGEAGAGGAGDGGDASSPSSSQSASSGDATSSSSTGGGGSPGCGNAAAPAGEAVRQLTIQGTERSFIVEAPGVIDPDRALGLVFVFHGNGGDGEGIRSMGIQDAPGARDEAIFVFPDGLPFKGFGVGWSGYCDGYDMELFDTIVETLSADYCIDPARIFAAGFSWGGDMCQSLACCRGDVVRAIAPASGPELYPPGECLDGPRPAFRMTYATNDAYPAQMFADRIAFYREEQGCAETSTPIEPSPCIAYDGCAEPVVACEYEGLGHAWPADYGVETWRFFQQFQ